MKTVLKVVLTVTFPIWIFPAMLGLGMWGLYALVSDIVDSFGEKPPYDPF